MTPVEETLAEFGRSLGLEALAWQSSGSLVLHIDSIGQLTFDLVGALQDSVCMSLARAVERPADIDLRRLLVRSRADTTRDFPVRAGWAGQHVVAAVLVPAADFTVPVIHEVIQHLEERHRSWEERT